MVLNIMLIILAVKTSKPGDGVGEGGGRAGWGPGASRGATGGVEGGEPVKSIMGF